MFRSGAKPEAKHLATGKWGEDEAVREIRREGLKILGRRVRVGKRDEVDIIAREGDVLVFVEVKTRANETFGRPLVAVDARKRARLSRAAVRYVAKLRNPRIYFRFDVVEVVGAPGGDAVTVRHIRNAFVLDRRYSLPG